MDKRADVISYLEAQIEAYENTLDACREFSWACPPKVIQITPKMAVAILEQLRG